MRMNIVFTMEGSSLLGEAPVVWQEVELREKDEKILREL